MEHSDGGGLHGRRHDVGHKVSVGDDDRLWDVESNRRVRKAYLMQRQSVLRSAGT